MFCNYYDEQLNQLSLEDRKKRRTVEGYPLNRYEISGFIERIQNMQGVFGLHVSNTFDDRAHAINQFTEKSDPYMSFYDTCKRKIISYDYQETPLLILEGSYSNENFWKVIKKVTRVVLENMQSFDTNKYIRYGEDVIPEIHFELVEDGIIDEILEQYTSWMEIFRDSKKNFKESAKVEYSTGILLQNPEKYASYFLNEKSIFFDKKPTYLMSIFYSAIGGIYRKDSFRYETFNGHEEKPDGKMLYFSRERIFPSLCNFVRILLKGPPAIDEKKYIESRQFLSDIKEKGWRH